MSDEDETLLGQWDRPRPTQSHRRRPHPGHATKSEEAAWTQWLIIALLFLIMVVLALILVVLGLMLHFLYAQIYPNVDSFMRSADTLDRALRLGEPTLDLLRSGVEGLGPLNFTAVVEAAAPSTQDDANSIFYSVLRKLDGTLGLLADARDKQVIDKVSPLLESASAGAAGETGAAIGRIVRWIEVRTADGSVDEAGSVTKAAIAHALNFTASESDTFTAIERLVVQLNPFVTNTSELIHFFNEVVSSHEVVEIRRRVSLLVDQLTEGARTSQIAESSIGIYNGIADLIRTVTSASFRDQVSQVFEEFPAFFRVVAGIVANLQGDGLRIGFGDGQGARGTGPPPCPAAV